MLSCGRSDHSSSGLAAVRVINHAEAAVKRRLILAVLFAAMLMAVSGSRASQATTVLNVGPVMPQVIPIGPGQLGNESITFEPDSMVGTLKVEISGIQGPPAQGAQIVGFDAACGTGVLQSGGLVLSDQGCFRGEIVIQQTLFLRLQCFRPGAYILSVTAAHVNTTNSQVFYCSGGNPIVTGPIPPISGHVPSWLLRLFETLGRPMPGPNG